MTVQRRYPGRVLVLALIGGLTACTSWRVQPVTPQRLLAEQHPEAVWVQGTNQSGVVLHRPFIRNDSLLGNESGGGGIVGIRLADVTRLEVREPDGGKTAGLVLGIVGGLGILVYIGIIAVLNDPNY